MIKKFDIIPFKKIKRISPSQFDAMKSCSYKSLLAEAFDKKPLLPLSPNAYMGTVSHKMLELISKGEIKTEEDFDAKFEGEISKAENNLRTLGYAFFTPLKMTVKDFGLQKMQLKKNLTYENNSREGKKTAKYDSEKWFVSKDDTVGGIIDLIIENMSTIEIIDFKTGRITESVLDDNGELVSEIKNEYQNQLKLYAYLYYENTGKFPTHLSLINLAKQKFKVEFSKEECGRLFDEAVCLLSETNKSLETGNFSVIPSIANCKYCLYRPACKYYHQYLPVEPLLNDICGTIMRIIQYQNGNNTIFIESNGRKISVTGLPANIFDGLKGIGNKKIRIFNLKKQNTETVYSATKTTMIYE